MFGKKVLINIGNGVVLSDAIAAILHDQNEAVSLDERPATIVLKGGGHLPTQRTFGDLSQEVEEATQYSPLTESVPEIVEAMQMLRGKLTGGDETDDNSPPVARGAGNA